MNERKCTRRRFMVLVGAAAAGAACAGCAGAAAEAGATTSTSGTRCPKGLVNDPYPGQCRSYRDTNGNGICDLSEA